MIAARQLPWIFALWASLAIAQAQPSTFATSPSPALANQPFAATFSTTTNPTAVGIWGNPQLQISGNTITIPFDYGCGFLCPGGGPAFKAFPFFMPALPAGAYVIRFVDASFSNLIAQFDLPIVDAPVASASVPALSPLLLALLALILIGTGSTFFGSGSR